MQLPGFAMSSLRPHWQRRICAAAGLAPAIANYAGVRRTTSIAAAPHLPNGTAFSTAGRHAYRRASRPLVLILCLRTVVC